MDKQKYNQYLDDMQTVRELREDDTLPILNKEKYLDRLQTRIEDTMIEEVLKDRKDKSHD